MKHKPYELDLLTMPLSRFTWDRPTSKLIAEESDFGSMREGRWWLQRLYNDACDVGIAVCSEITGCIVKFYLDREEKDDEGDLLALHFKPIEKGPISEVVILND